MTVQLESDLLRSFVAVADLENFTRAANVLGRTQSAISMQMKRLEELVICSAESRTPTAPCFRLQERENAS